MADVRSIRIGTLGSAVTFAGEATSSMRRLYPEFSEPAYFPSLEACWAALKKGTVDAVVLGVERTGQPHHGEAVIEHGFYVIGELSQPLACNLYVKPGTKQGDIRKITGHGSVFQCTAWLGKHLPNAELERHGLNSVEAARGMMAGDGTVAVVGTKSLPSLVTGLELVAEAIDDGAIAKWWAVANRPIFSDTPDTVVVTARCGPDGQLGSLIGALGAAGFVLRTAAAFPVNAGVSLYDYTLTLGGKGARKDAEKAVARCSSARLAGAYERRD